MRVRQEEEEDGAQAGGMQEAFCWSCIGSTVARASEDSCEVLQERGVVFDRGGPWRLVRRTDITLWGCLWGDASLEQCLGHGWLPTAMHNSAASSQRGCHAPLAFILSLKPAG